MDKFNSIKVCVEPGCSAVYHQIPKVHTRCNSCNGWLIAINHETYWKKFALNWFQYDFPTDEYYRPVSEMISVKDELPKIGRQVFALCEDRFGEQSIHQIKRIEASDLFKKWQWSGINSKSYFTLKVIDWMYIYEDKITKNKTNHEPISNIHRNLL